MSTYVDQDGTIVVDESKLEPTKYKMKEKLKACFAGLCFALVLSLLWNFYQLNQINELKTQYSDFYNYVYEPMYNEFSFYNSNAVIVADNGKTYHAYSCPTWKSSKGIHIFNKEYAEYMGKKPCAECSAQQNSADQSSQSNNEQKQISKEDVSAAEQINQRNDELIEKYGDAELNEQMKTIAEEAREKAEADKDEIIAENKEWVDEVAQIQAERAAREKSQ